MVSIKFSVAAATAALLHVASARKCTASVQDFVDGGIGGGAFTHYRIGVRFNGNEDYLDSQDTDSKDDLDIYDGKQTLTSDKLGGDVLIWADKADVTGQSRLDGCRVEFMDSGSMEGTVEGGKMSKTCKVGFDC